MSVPRDPTGKFQKFLRIERAGKLCAKYTHKESQNWEQQKILVFGLAFFFFFFKSPKNCKIVVEERVDKMEE